MYIHASSYFLFFGSLNYSPTKQRKHESHNSFRSFSEKNRCCSFNEGELGKIFHIVKLFWESWSVDENDGIWKKSAIVTVDYSLCTNVERFRGNREEKREAIHSETIAFLCLFVDFGGSHWVAFNTQNDLQYPDPTKQEWVKWMPSDDLRHHHPQLVRHFAINTFSLNS